MHAMVGNRSGETHRLGDRVTVKLVEAAPVAGALRFELLSEGRVMTGAQRRPSDRPGSGSAQSAAREEAVSRAKSLSWKAPMTDIPPELMQKFSTDALSGHPNIAPKDASTLILLDRSGAGAEGADGQAPCTGHVFMPGALRVSRRRRRSASTGGCRSASPLDPRAEAKLMLHDQAARTPPRRAPWRSPPSARHSRRPGCCSARSATTPPAVPDGAWAAFAEAKHPARPVHHAFHRPRGHAAAAQAALRHPLLHRRRQRHRAQDRRQGRPRCRTGGTGVAAANEIKQRIELMAITEIVLRDLQEQIETGFSHDLPVPYFHVRPRQAGRRGARICEPRFLDFRGQNLSFRPNRR